MTREKGTRKTKSKPCAHLLKDKLMMFVCLYEMCPELESVSCLLVCVLLSHLACCEVSLLVMAQEMLGSGARIFMPSQGSQGRCPTGPS